MVEETQPTENVNEVTHTPAGTEVTVGNNDYLILREGDILAIL